MNEKISDYLFLPIPSYQQHIRLQKRRETVLKTMSIGERVQELVNVRANAVQTGLRGPRRGSAGCLV